MTWASLSSLRRLVRAERGYETGSAGKKPTLSLAGQYEPALYAEQNRRADEAKNIKIRP